MLNSYRSAVAQILSFNLAQDSRIKHFFKGVYQLRPSKLRYTNTWDPSMVLQFLKNWNNEDISLENLTYKLSMLLALATGQRVQTIALIELNNIISERSVEIKISGRIKSYKKNSF